MERRRPSPVSAQVRGCAMLGARRRFAARRRSLAALVFARGPRRPRGFRRLQAIGDYAVILAAPVLARAHRSLAQYTPLFGAKGSDAAADISRTLRGG
jgi:hypothetical protein